MTLEYSVTVATTLYGCKRQQIAVIDLSTGTSKFLIGNSGATSIAPRGADVLAVPFYTRGSITVWDVDTEKESILFQGCGDKKAGSAIRVLKAISEGIYTARLYDDRLIVYSMHGTKETERKWPPDTLVPSVSLLSPLSRDVLLHTTNEGAAIWDLTSDNKDFTPLEIDQHVVFRASGGSKRALLIYLSGEDLMSFDAATRIVSTFAEKVGDSSTIDSLRVLQDGRVMLIGDGKRFINIWEEGNSVSVFLDPGEEVWEILELKDSRLVTTTSSGMFLWPCPQKDCTESDADRLLLWSDGIDGDKTVDFPRSIRQIIELSGERLAIVANYLIHIFDLTKRTFVKTVGSYIDNVILLEPSKRERMRVACAVRELFDGVLVKDLLSSVVKYF